MGIKQKMIGLVSHQNSTQGNIKAAEKKKIKSIPQRCQCRQDLLE